MNLEENIYSKKPNYSDFDGIVFVKNFGDVEREYRALRNGSILYDCGNYGIYSVTGEEACGFLDRLSSKHITFMNIGSVIESCFLDENGDVIGAVFIVRREVDYLLITSWEFVRSVFDWITKKGKEYSVTIKSLGDELSMISVEGCQSWQIIKNIFNTEVENISLHTIQSMEYEGRKVSVLRIGRTSEYGYLIISEAKTQESIYKMILLQRDTIEFPLEESGFDCIELAMLEVHQPNFTKETKDFGNIFELGQQWYLCYDKEDYIGYERVKEITGSGISRSSVCFVAEGTALETGTDLYAFDEKIGKVIYSISYPWLEKTIGAAILDEPYAQSGLELEADAGGERLKLITVSSPIVRPHSWDSKME